MNQPFSHGVSSLEWQGDILVLRAQHAFNRAGIKAEKKKLESWVRQRLDHSPAQPWGRLAVIDDDALPTYDSCELLLESLDWVRKHGCVAGALVTSHILLYKRIFADATLPMGFFDNEDDARIWLQQQLMQSPSIAAN